MDCVNDNQENLMFTVHENGKQNDADEKYKSDPNGGMDYVAATLHAWNQCPTIVKKQMDDQYQELVLLKEQLRSANLKLNQRKQEFERHAAVDMKVDLIKHKDKIEALARQKLEDEKVKLNKKKVQEMDEILQENFALKKQVADFQAKNKKIMK
jgi:hypothetical protein